MNHAPFTASSVWLRMGRTILVVATLGTLSFLASCANKAASGPHATILMRDGTSLAGTVTATSPAEITVAGDDNASHTIPMGQVKSIEYDEAAAQASGTPGAETPARPALKTRKASDAAHENHYHPPQSEIHTKTYVLETGTKISVRT